MTEKSLVQQIRGAGNIARILGVFNFVLHGIAYGPALLGASWLTSAQHLTELFYLAVSVALLVLGQRVYKSPDHHQEYRLYQILCLCFVVVVLAIIQKTIPPIFFILLFFFIISTLVCLKKHGPIMHLNEVLEDIQKPAGRSEAEQKQFNKAVRRSAWKTIGKIVGVAFALLAVVIIVLFVFAE